MREELRTPAGYIDRDPDLTTAVRIIDLVEGQAPHLPWPEYDKIIREIPSEHAEYGYSNVEHDTRPAVGNIHGMWSLDTESYVLLAPGSHQIIRETITEVIPGFEGKYTIKGVGPHFPEVERFATSPAAKKAGTRYVATETYLNPIANDQSPSADAVFKMIRELEEIPAKRHIFVYASGVNSFTGEMVPTDVWHKLAAVCNKKDFYFMADEAVDDVRPMEESLIHKISEQRKTLILRSPSKVAGIGDDRLAYAIGSSDWENMFFPAKGVFDLNWFQKALANRIFDPEIYIPRIEEMKAHTGFLKGILLEELQKKDVKIYPTSPETPFFAISGPDVGFYNRLVRIGVAGVSGGKYKETNPRLSERDVRFAVPNGKDIPEFAYRVGEAWNTRPKTYFTSKPESDERMV